MDSQAPPRSVSEAPSSSSSDFYSTDTAVKDQLTIPPAPEDAEPATCELPQPPEHARNDYDEGDSSSEMDLSSPSPPSTPLSPRAASATDTNQAGAKRKLSDSVDVDTTFADSLEDSVKRRRLSANPKEVKSGTARMVQLPPEIWQRVFLHLPPAMLSRCLRVCQDFKHCLTGQSAQQNVSQLSRLRIHPMDSEAIWTHSRKTFLPLLPRPLTRCSELGMLQLLGGSTCQFCGRSPLPSPATTVFNAGPGSNGLRVVWPFGVRTCGVCLKSRMIKDVEVLSNHLFKDLRFAVPYGFCSQDLHFASDSVRTQVQGGIPASLRFSKIMYRPDLEYIKAEEENAKMLGDGAADEWRKGLFNHGKEAMADSARWERWELQLRPGTSIAQVLREYDISSFPRHVEEARSRSTGVKNPQPLVTANGTHPLPQPVHVFSHGHSTPFVAAQPQFSQIPLSQQQLHKVSYHRPPRNPQEVEEARQARKADIERRCRNLEPPLEPNVLQHMDSFQAALQITTPMTDTMWDMLKPRIIAQREAAELAEHDRASQLAALQAAMPSAGSDEMVSRPGKEPYDREYELAQEPLRKRLGEYADDYINGQWGGGRMLEKDNAPIFAIHVLMHVRRRYHEDANLGLLPKFDPPKRKDVSRQVTPALEPFLSLDNMKWIYDHKVRPLIDIHRREHFICAGCIEEKKPKWFAFEGLIQHYGAKHTAAFSKGNIVVHWPTAEWPEEPPFHTNPGYWLKVDRRTSDHKSHSRARQASQNNHESPFPARATAPHLMENPYYPSANGYSSVNPGYCPSHFTALSSQDGLNGYLYPQAVLAEPQIDVTYDTKLKKLASDARETWDSLDGIQDLEACVRIQTSIHHASSRCQERFHLQPSLDMLTDALATDSSMRPLKNAYGMACRSCIVASSNATSGSYWVRMRDAKLYNTSSLITHFKLMHVANDQTGYVDWMKDMMEIPDNKQMKELLRAVGMDDDKLALIAAAFPAAFPSPLPRIGVVTEAAPDSAADGRPGRLLDRLKKPKNNSKKKTQKGANGVVIREGSQDPLPEPTEDEYDPRRPMFVQTKQEAADPSKFDTDARKAAGPTTQLAGNLNLNTLAALHAVVNRTASSACVQDAPSRSPSVGRPETPSTLRASAAANVVTPTDPPDISAILASLTGQNTSIQTTTPPASAVSYRPVSVARQSHVDPYVELHHEPTSGIKVENRRSSGRHDPYHAATEPAASRGLQELQAALSNNHRQFERNQHHTYADVPYASAGQPAPPRYQYVYEGEPHYNHPSAPQSMYREVPPSMEYVQMPQDRELTAPGYQYERAAPKQIYVDQYGRPLELIPIDTAPTPVQYGQSQFEQLSYSRRQEPVYVTMPAAGHYQTVNDDRRPVYYEQVCPGSNGVLQRYV